MAENLDSPSLGTFGIEDTFELGAGNAELIKDLLSPETSTSDPDKIKPIEDNTDDDSKKPKPAGEKKDNKPQGSAAGESDKGQSLINQLLGEDITDDNDDGDNKDDDNSGGDNSNDDDNKTGDDSQFGALAKDLFKLGVFTLDDGEEEPSIATPQEFLDRFNEEKKKGAIEVVNNFIGQFGEDYQQAFDAIYVKGVNPKEYFGLYNDIVDISELDMTVEENQVQVVKMALAEQGYEAEDITKEVERLINYGDLGDVATRHQKVLMKKKATQMKQLEEQKALDLQRKVAVRNQYIQNVQTILQDKLKAKEFDGIPINPKLATELQDFLLVDKYKTASGETLTDFDRVILDLKRPENHEMKVKVALILKILEKDPTLSTIQKSGISKKTDELFGEVARQQTKAKPPIGGQQNKKSSWSL